jgi:hypothetical protein
LQKNGRITLRGTRITTEAEKENKIQGTTVRFN